jgi:glycosyltransferase involved in cell wall biosynthesis
MAMSSLVLATPIGGLCEIIKDGETGLLAKDTSPEAISELLLRALKMNTREREVIQQNALSNVNNNYLWTNIAKQVMEVYECQ